MSKKIEKWKKKEGCKQGVLGIEGATTLQLPFASSFTEAPQEPKCSLDLRHTGEPQQHHREPCPHLLTSHLSPSQTELSLLGQQPGTAVQAAWLKKSIIFSIKHFIPYIYCLS